MQYVGLDVRMHWDHSGVRGALKVGLTVKEAQLEDSGQAHFSLMYLSFLGGFLPCLLMCTVELTPGDSSLHTLSDLHLVCCLILHHISFFISY